MIPGHAAFDPRSSPLPGLLLLALCILFCRPAAGDINLEDGLDISEALALALARSHELRIWQARRQEAEGRALSLETWSNPELRSQDWSILGPLGPSGSPIWKRADLSLRFRPPRPGVQANQAQGAWRRAEAAALNELRARQLLGGRVRGLYLHLLGLGAQQELDRRELERQSHLRDLVRQGIAAGSATDLDQSLSELDQWEAMRRLDSLGEQRRRVWLELAALTGLEPRQSPELLPAPLSEPCPMPGVDDDTLLARAESQRPDLRAMRKAVEEVNLRLAAEGWARLPWPGFLELAYCLGRDHVSDSLELGLAVDLPLIDLHKGEIRTLQGLLARRRAELDLRRQEMEIELRQAADALRTSHRVLLGFERVWPAIQASLKQVQLAIDAGEADIFRLAPIRERELRLRRGRIDARLRCHLARVALDLALGEP